MIWSRKEIVDIAVGKNSIRDNDCLVAGRPDLGADYVHFADVAFVALRLYEIAGLERFEYQDHDAAGEVLDRAAEGHAYCHTSCCQKCRQGSRVDAESADGDYYDYRSKKDADEAGRERNQRLFSTFLLEHLGQQRLDFTDKPYADDIYEKCCQYLEAERYGVLPQAAQKLIRVLGEVLDRAADICLQRVGDCGRTVCSGKDRNL